MLISCKKALLHNRNAVARRWVRRSPGREDQLDGSPRRGGFTLIEVLAAVAISGILMLALGGAVTNTLAVRKQTQARNALTRDIRFTMDRILRSISRTEKLLIPLEEDPNTGRSESFIDPGFLAVTLDPEMDRDRDGIADADNDGDGRVDEDLPADSTHDGRAGVHGLDDNNNGIPDFSLAGNRDDDETGFIRDEDPINGIDDDGDSAIDEDPPADMNGDGAPGIAGVDDDGDGAIDEGDAADDDEDGTVDEDWYDVVAYRLNGTTLTERMPNLNPADGSDYTERVLAENVELFQVERIARGSDRFDLVQITLRIGRDGESLTVRQSIRVGGAR